MQIEIKMDPACREPKVVIFTDKVDDRVNDLVKRLSEEKPQVLAGFREEELQLLKQEEIYRIYASDGKVLCETGEGEFTLRLRLYELEDRLDKRKFVRISNSEIINLGQVRRFDLRMTGTICVSLKNGAVTYVSRRYVTKIKQVLGI